MKKSSALTIAIAVILSSCGTTAQLSSTDNSARFQDGIYSSSPSFRTAQQKQEDEARTDELVRKTKESAIYLFGDKKDTVMIPENMSARIQFDQKVGGTVVTVGENPYDWRLDLENNYGYYYGPYSIGSSWYWSRHYSPWYWNSWAYTPWRYSGWYDPFYMSGWYDPWYYGYSGWYDPWYYGWHHRHHYCGWYGGWDPHWGHIHYPGVNLPENNRDRWHGLRAGTGSVQIASGTNTLRGGGSSGTRIGTTRGESSSGTGSTIRRTSSKTASAARVPSKPSMTRAPKKTVTPESVSGSRPTVTDKKMETSYKGKSTYRKPASATSATRNISEGRSKSGSDENKSYNGRTSERATSSYNRSSSYDRSSSGYSAPSYNRSSGSASGGFSRGGGGNSGGGRRR